eukprot:bmy_03657T0
MENLLNPASQRRPWLSCPQDKSGQLKVELQVERAVPIGYVDVVFLSSLHGTSPTWCEGEMWPLPLGQVTVAVQIDVGRSSWSLDRPFVTLLPAAMLMSLADSKQGKNCSGNRMFKDDDFLAPASGESWDRLHLTCSQPFTHHQSFGLAFLWVCSSLDTLDDPVVGPSAPVSSGLSQGSSDAQKSGPNPWLANPSIWRTFFPDPQTYDHQGNFRAQEYPKAAAARDFGVFSLPGAFSFPQGTSSPCGKPKTQPCRTRSRSSGQHRPVFNSNSRPKQRGLAKAGQREHQRPQARSSGVQDSGQCPICAGSFSIVMLPQHAATCGETSPPPQASPSSSPSSSPSVLWVSSPESSPPISWIQCPICQLLFSAGEIEEHASMCGEVLQA